MSLIKQMMQQTSESVIPFLKELATRDGIYTRAFRIINKIKNVPIRVQYYSDGESIVLIGLEHHNKKTDWLADEEPFMEDPPLYFSENSHYQSPVYTMRKFRDEMMSSTFKINHQPWLVLVTNGYVINIEDMAEDVWLPMKVLVFSGVKENTDTFLPENINSVDHWFAGVDVFCKFTSCVLPTWEEKYQEEEGDTTTTKIPVPSFSSEDFAFELDDEEKKEYLHNAVPSTPQSPPFYPQQEEPLRVEILSPLKNPQKEFEKLVGCDQIRIQIKQLESLCRYNKMRSELHSKRHQVSLHAIFIGNPGTGKTSMAKIYASLLHQAGVLSKGHVVMASRASFVSTLWGGEEKNVNRILKKAEGGVLFIDEAYEFSTENQQDPARHILPLLMPILGDEERRDIAVVLAGYKKPIENLLSLNNGLKSRFCNVFEFPDFSVEELLEISKRRIKEYGYYFTAKSWLLYTNMVKVLYDQRDEKTFGNAREIGTLLDRIYVTHAQRCIQQNILDNALTVSDVKAVIRSIPQKQPQRTIGFVK